MFNNLNIKPPFFEVGPKAYLYGEKMLKLAKVIDKTAMKYDVDVIVTPQYTDISLLANNTERIFIFAQHMDYLPVGRGLGSVLPEAVKEACAVGVMGIGEDVTDRKWNNGEVIDTLRVYTEEEKAYDERYTLQQRR